MCLLLVTRVTHHRPFHSSQICRGVWICRLFCFGFPSQVYLNVGCFCSWVLKGFHNKRQYMPSFKWIALIFFSCHRWAQCQTQQSYKARRSQEGSENMQPFICSSYYTQGFFSYSLAQWTDQSIFIDFGLTRRLLNISSHRMSRTTWGWNSMTTQIQNVNEILKGT